MELDLNSIGRIAAMVAVVGLVLVLVAVGFHHLTPEHERGE